MKNDAIKKINLIGKISQIVVTVVQALMIVMMAVFAVLAVAGLFVEDNALSLNFNADATVTVDTSDFPLSIIEADDLEDFDINVAGLEFDTANATEEGGKVTVNAKSSFNLQELYDELDGVIGLGGIICIACSALVIMGLAIFITLVFARKLARAFEKCESPFEENVTKRMKHFAYSLIPWFAITLLGEGLLGSINLMTIMLAAVVFLVIYIFNYGAQLQRESDETL